MIPSVEVERRRSTSCVGTIDGSLRAAGARRTQPPAGPPTGLLSRSGDDRQGNVCPLVGRARGGGRTAVMHALLHRDERIPQAVRTLACAPLLVEYPLGRPLHRGQRPARQQRQHHRPRNGHPVAELARSVDGVAAAQPAPERRDAAQAAGFAVRAPFPSRSGSRTPGRSWRPRSRATASSASPSARARAGAARPRASSGFRAAATRGLRLSRRPGHRPHGRRAASDDNHGGFGHS